MIIEVPRHLKGIRPQDFLQWKKLVLNAWAQIDFEMYTKSYTSHGEIYISCSYTGH